MRSVMTRTRQTQRGAELESRGAQLAGVTATLSPVHVAAVDMLTGLLGMAKSFTDKDTPAWLKTMLRTIDHGRPFILDGISKVPEAEIVRFMADLAARIQTIVDAGTPDATVITLNAAEHESDHEGTASDDSSDDAAAGEPDSRSDIASPA